MKTLELMNGVFYSSYRALKKIHEPIMWIVYGLNCIMPATSRILDELCTKKHSFPDGSFISFRTSLALNT